MAGTVTELWRAARFSRRAAILGVAGLALLLVVLRACGAGASNGGFQLQQGGVSGFGNYTGRGVPADFSGFVGRSSAPVTLLSATLLPIPGFPVPRLVHLGVHVIQRYGDVGEANYWPPRLPPMHPGGPPVTVPVTPFHGYRLSAGNHPLMLIFYSFEGSRPGTAYFAAGLRITYQVGPSEYTGDWYAFGESCVAARWTLGHQPSTRCSSAQVDHAQDVYARIAK